MQSNAFQEESRRVPLGGDRDCTLNVSERNGCLSGHNKDITKGVRA